MPGSTYSSNLKIELMTTGENSGTWGDITNTNLGTALEQAVIGLGNPDYTSDANLTITITNSNAAQAARALVLNVTSTFGSLTATRELVVPTIQKQYIVQNNTSGGQSITVKTSAGTGITVPNGRKAHLYVNGTDVIQMFDFVNILGGTIDNATLGATTASSARVTTLNASGAATLDGNVALGNAAGDVITVPGTLGSSLLFTDNTYDIGASGATRPRNLFLAGAATIGGNLSVGGTLTLTGGVNLNGNVTVGDNSSDTLTINSTITSNLIFTDNTYDIGASGATRPRNLFLAGNATVGGSQTLTGALTVDSTTDSSSTTTGSIQTDGGLGVAKAAYIGTVLSVGGKVTLQADTPFYTGANLSSGANALGIGGTAGNSLIGFFVNNAEQMRLTATGLGIGTTPSNRLHVVYGGSTVGAQFTASAGYAQMQLTAAGSNQSAYYTFNVNGTGKGIVQVNAVDALTLDSSGNVSVGISSANAKLNVVTALSGTYGSAGIWLSDNSTTSMLMNNTASGVSSIWASGALTFGSGGNNNTERMRINASGYVGIGSNAPGRPLDIAFAASIDTTGGSGKWTAGFRDTTAMAAGVGGGLLFQGLKSTAGSVGNFGAIAGLKENGTDGNEDGYLGFFTVPNSTGLITERARITSSGNFGIGTSSPGRRLSVSNAGAEGFEFGPGVGGSGGNELLNYNRATSLYVPVLHYASTHTFVSGTAGGTTAAFISGSGNVGLGTTNPTQKLYVVGNGLFEAGFTYWTNTANTPGSTAPAIWSPASGTMGFWANGAERMRLSDSGNFLIGGTTVNINEKLGVYGDQNSSLNIRVRNTSAGSSASSAIALNAAGNTWGIEIGSAAKNGNALTFQLDYGGTNSEKMRLTPDGRLGIGTTSPSVTLELSQGNNTAIRIIDDAGSGRGAYVRATGTAAEFGSTSSVRPVVFTVDSVERARITADGQLIVGGTTQIFGNTRVMGQGGPNPVIAYGSDTGYTQGAFISASGTDSSPSGRGQGVYMWNQGNNTTWYMGTVYGAADTWYVTRRAVAGFQDSAAETVNAKMWVTSSGVAFQGNNSSTWSTVSDARVKEDVNTIEGGLDVVLALRPVEYFNKITKKREENFIAQEYEQVLAKHVTREKPSPAETEFVTDEILRLNPNLVPYLVSAIKELKSQLDSVKAELATLKGA